VPLTDSERKLVLARFAAKTPGTMFDAGSMNPAVSLEARLKGQR
jgi:hypothetical protein